MASDLRSRILEAMPAILRLIGNETRTVGTGGDGDFRPLIVDGIRRVAGVEVAPSPRLLDRVREDARRLGASLRKLPPSVRSQNEDLLGALARLTLPPTVDPTTSSTRRTKRVAAALACDLLMDFGGYGHMPTLTRGGIYFALAARLYRVATGHRGNLERVCAEHLREEFNQFSPRGPKPQPPPALGALTEEVAAREYARRTAMVSGWRPLQEVVDEAFEKGTMAEHLTSGDTNAI